MHARFITCPVRFLPRKKRGKNIKHAADSFSSCGISPTEQWCCVGTEGHTLVEEKKPSLCSGIWVVEGRRSRGHSFSEIGRFAKVLVLRGCFSWKRLTGPLVAARMANEFLGMNLTCMVDSLQRYQLPSSHDCLFPLLSKILGYAIVAGASIVKLPQIVLILKNKSIKGLSVSSFELEVVGFTIALAYCLWKQLPFAAFGELVFLLLQGIVIVVLIYYYSSNLGPLTWLKTAAYCAITPQLLAGNINDSLFETLYASQHAVLIFARVPQISQNYKTKNTGQLSFSTNFLSFAGGAVRLLTLIQEGAPHLMLLGSVLGCITNGIIVSQMVFYSRTAARNNDKVKAS